MEKPIWYVFPSCSVQQSSLKVVPVLGDVIFTRFFRTPALIINSLQAAQDLMEKKSARYSDRPTFISLVELSVFYSCALNLALTQLSWSCSIGYGSSIVFFPYGERFRKHRKWIHDSLEGKGSAQMIQPLQRREAYIMLAGMVQDPDAFMTHIKRQVDVRASSGSACI